MAYAKIENGAVQIYHSLPQNYTFADGSNTGNFADMSADIHKAEGFLPLEDSPPAYDPQLYTLEHDGYEVTEKVIRQKYKVTPIPQEIIDARAAEAIAAAWGAIRATRNQLLAETDRKWDAPNREAYALYRQSLRDIPATYPTPDAVIWPDKPE